MISNVPYSSRILQVKRVSNISDDDVDNLKPPRQLRRAILSMRRSKHASIEDMSESSSDSGTSEIDFITPRTKLLPHDPVCVITSTSVPLLPEAGPNYWTPVEIIVPKRSISGSILLFDDDRRKSPSSLIDSGRIPSSSSVIDGLIQSPSSKTAALMSPKKSDLIYSFPRIELEPLSEPDSEEEDDDTAIPPHRTPSLLVSLETEKVKTLFKKQKHSIPGCSPFAMRVFSNLKKSPFDRPELGSLGPRELSYCLEDAYCPLSQVLHAQTIRLSPHDVVVCSPLRTGQSAILRGLTMLAAGSTDEVDTRFLLNHIGFLGSNLPNLPNEGFTKRDGTTRRLFKTHINLRCFVRDESQSKHSPKSK